MYELRCASAPSPPSTGNYTHHKPISLPHHHKKERKTHIDVQMPPAIDTRLQDDLGAAVDADGPTVLGDTPNLNVRARTRDRVQTSSGDMRIASKAGSGQARLRTASSNGLRSGTWSRPPTGPSAPSPRS